MAKQYLTLINGIAQPVEATVVSAGVASAGNIVALAPDGRLDPSVTPTNMEIQSFTAIAHEALSPGDWISVYDDAGTKKVALATAANTTRRCSGYVDAVYAPGATVTYFVGGVNLNDVYTAADVGKLVFLGTTAGGSQLARPVPPPLTNYKYQVIGSVEKVGTAYVVLHAPFGTEYLL